MSGLNPDPDRFSFFIGKGLKDSGSGTTANVMAAVQSCANNGAKVVAMSLGGSLSSSVTDQFFSGYLRSVLLQHRVSMVLRICIILRGILRL